MATTIKQPSETLLTAFDFSKRMATAELILTVDSTVSDPVGMTFGASTVNAQTVDILVSGGLAPSREDVDATPYKLTMIVTTDAGQVLEKDVPMDIKEI